MSGHSYEWPLIYRYQPRITSSSQHTRPQSMAMAMGKLSIICEPVSSDNEHAQCHTLNTSRHPPTLPVMYASGNTRLLARKHARLRCCIPATLLRISTKQGIMIPSIQPAAGTVACIEFAYPLSPALVTTHTYTPACAHVWLPLVAVALLVVLGDLETALIFRAALMADSVRGSLSVVSPTHPHYG